MTAVFIILSAVTAAALVYSLRMNRLLSEQINALSDRLDTLSKKSGKRFNKYEKKLAQQRHKQMQQAAKQRSEHSREYDGCCGKQRVIQKRELIVQIILKHITALSLTLYFPHSR